MIEPESTFWLRPERGEVVVQHYPDGDGPLVLLTLDAETLEPKDSAPLPVGTFVKAIGATTWLDDLENPVLEPGGFPAPDVRINPETSPAGSYFLTANGDDDVVYFSAIDGSVIGAITAGMNPTGFSAWTSGDVSQARLTIDGQIEIYDFSS